MATLKFRGTQARLNFFIADCVLHCMADIAKSEPLQTGNFLSKNLHKTNQTTESFL